MDNQEIQLKPRPSIGERIHNFLASYEKSPIIDGLIVGAITVAFGSLGGPIVSARALGGGLFGSIAMRYMGDRAKEINELRKNGFGNGFVSGPQSPILETERKPED